MSETMKATKEMIADWRRRAALGDKDAIEKLAYLATAAPVEATATVLEHSVDIAGSVVDDIGDAIDGFFDW